jgi:hypothetical protein
VLEHAAGVPSTIRSVVMHTRIATLASHAKSIRKVFYVAAPFAPFDALDIARWRADGAGFWGHSESSLDFASGGGAAHRV